jgi:crotonobetaine/carnitine-CoA ligase
MQPVSSNEPKNMSTTSWSSGQQTTIPRLLRQRLESDPDGPYLDVCGDTVTASELNSRTNRLARGLFALGLKKGDRVASLMENSLDAVVFWWAVVKAGGIAVPINTAYKGEYLRHQLADSQSRWFVIQGDFADRARDVVSQLSELESVVVIGEPNAQITGKPVHAWESLLQAEDKELDVPLRPSDLGTFIYTGGTTGLSKGCMLSHAYHEVLSQQIGQCWRRTAEDVVWTPLPLFHYNALVTAVLGPVLFGGRAAVYRKFSVSQFWPEMNRTGATITSTLGTMAYLLAHDEDRPEMPRSGAPQANRTLRLMGAAPLPVEVDRILKQRFGFDTFSGAYGVTEASLISWQPAGVQNKPNAAGMINEAYFDVRIFDEDDNELPQGSEGEIVIRPKRPNVMFEGYWGRPEATVATSRNWWYHTGDVGRIDEDDYLYFVDRKADYLRRRGENISSFEVERILMRHGALADVVVHAVPSKLTEDDLKITATLQTGARVSEADLFRWCIDQLPYFALPRYIEFRRELPRSPVGRVLKRVLREQGATPQTWDAETSGITYERR